MKTYNLLCNTNSPASIIEVEDRNMFQFQTEGIVPLEVNVHFIVEDEPENILNGVVYNTTQLHTQEITLYECGVREFKYKMIDGVIYPPFGGYVVHFINSLVNNYRDYDWANIVKVDLHMTPKEARFDIELRLSKDHDLYPFFVRNFAPLETKEI